MNALVRRYLKTAILFLVLGLGIGVWMLLAREFGIPLPVRVRSAHIHAVLVGFVLMMIAGVALWMFPRIRPDDSRHRPWLAESAWWCIALGTGVRVALELTLPGGSGTGTRAVLVGAGVAQFVGLLLFFWGIWPRIRSSRPDGG
jgi:heme/copper-type cytochrome/quinol oxidase subunit 1